MMKNLTNLIGTVMLVAMTINPSMAAAMGKKPPMDESTKNSTDSSAQSATVQSTSISVEVLYRNQQCSGLQPLIQWVESQSEYQTLFHGIRKSYVGAQAEPPAVDFTQYGVLLVAMGQKNTGGYAVDLAADEAHIRQKVLQISVQWREPGKGMMVTQALTSPCLLLKLPKAQFERIEIKDQRGVVRLSGTAKP
jgi:hypothetical protein